MDLDLDNVLEVNEIRKLISHKKNLLDFFDELVKIKNIEVNTQIICLIIYSSQVDSISLT